MFQETKQIIDTLKKHGFIAYIAGGSVRDILLGNKISDFDIATNATPIQIEKLFKSTIPVGKQFGVILVIINKKSFEVATFRKDTTYSDGRHPESIIYGDIKTDAQRRDFTINGLYADIDDISYNKSKDTYELDLNKVIDYVGGVKDLKDNILRFIGNADERILEDHLRIIRAIRFKNKLGFTYEKKTKKSLILYKDIVSNISKERLQEELTKILHLKDNYKAFKEMYNIGILQIIIPEISDMDKINQEPKFHKEGDVWTHTLKCLKGSYREQNDVLWAILLHDVGKKYTTFTDEKGRIRSNNHDIIGAKYVQKTLERLKFSTKSIHKIKWLIEQHLRIHFIFDMKLHKQKTLCYHEYFPDLLRLQYFDEKGRIPSNIKHHKDTIKLYKKLLKEKEKDITPLLNGIDIIQILNIKQGKKVGEIIEKLKIAQYENIVNNKNEAIKFIQSI